MELNTPLFEQLRSLKRRQDFKDLISLRTSEVMEKLSFYKLNETGNLYFLPLGAAAKRNLREYIMKEFIAHGFSPIETPTLHSPELWEKSQRMKKFKNSMIFTEGPRVLFPTSEEPVHYFLGKIKGISYRDLPLKIVQSKRFFRKPPKSSRKAIRQQEFEVVDGYVIYLPYQEEEVKKTSYGLFEKIIHSTGMRLVPVSKEREYSSGGYTDYRILTEEGDDKVPGTGKRSLSVGVIMFLEDRYSRQFGLQATGRKGERIYPYAVSLGFGVERSLYAVFHSNRSERDGIFTINWPPGFEPVFVYLAALPGGEAARVIYKELLRRGTAVILDNTRDYISTKFSRAIALGAPYFVVIGSREEKSGKYRLESLKDGREEVLTREELVDALTEKYKKLYRKL